MGVQTEVKPVSVFAGIQDAPPDPILSLGADFRADPAAKKLNVSVGAYRTDDGKPYVLPVVSEVEKMLIEDPSKNHEYLPIEGLAEFRSATAKLAFGEACPAIREGRCVTIQALSVRELFQGTGALRVGMEFLRSFYRPDAVIYIPDPTWPNHKNIVPRAGLPPARTYRYFNAQTKGVDFAGMMEDIGEAPTGSVIVLHPCAHNPTGADLTFDQWKELYSVIVSKSHLPFFDSAYQGFATGDLIRDRFAMEYFASQGIEMLLSQSYAKNMGLYGERVGALSVIVRDPSLSSRVLGQLKGVVRPMYSSPPGYGAKIASKILGDRELFDKWNGELKIMSGRILEMRDLLVQALIELKTPGDWSFLQQQIGMFSYTGLSATQVDYIRDKYHIYMTRNGRISMAGVTSSTVKYLAEALDDATRNAA